ncbi:MAG TPA: metallophosphoesterase family protein [Caulobacterales bacterium]|nr:metallophosphoesterase family protein [Caulobacterales bacterium]
MRISKSRAKRLPAFPAGRLGFAVGDVHGRADLLEKLLRDLEQLAEGEASDTPMVVFAGDYIDRGPDSKDVLDLLLAGRPFGFERRFLKGNHEQLMLDFCRNPVRARTWLAHGGANTLASYGVRPPPPGANNPAAIADAGEALRDRMPKAHARFLAELERYVEAGDYLFVHAGIDPAKPLKDQTDSDLFWIRDRFLQNTKPTSHCVVHGHTPVRAPTIEGSRIAIDTGAYATGVLTAARLEGTSVSFLTARTAGYSRA